MLVELKNGETLNGHLVNCDNWMNLILREVVQTSPEGDRFFRLPEVYIRGNNVCIIALSAEPFWAEFVLFRLGLLTTRPDQVPQSSRGDYRSCQGAAAESTTGPARRTRTRGRAGAWSWWWPWRSWTGSRTWRQLNMMRNSASGRLTTRYPEAMEWVTGRSVERCGRVGASIGRGVVSGSVFFFSKGTIWVFWSICDLQILHSINPDSILASRRQHCRTSSERIS